MSGTITEISQDRFTGPAFGLGGVLRDNSAALSNAYTRTVLAMRYAQGR
jgi:hypothetical protein